MAVYTQKGGATVQAFQWTGQARNTFPQFAQQLAIHISDGKLHVPTRQGTLAAQLTDWVVMDADGSITIIPNTAFSKLYQ